MNSGVRVTKLRRQLTEGCPDSKNIERHGRIALGRESSVPSVRYFETATLLARNHAVKDSRFPVKGQRGPSSSGRRNYFGISYDPGNALIERR